jgi:hypothetical protein
MYGMMMSLVLPETKGGALIFSAVVLTSSKACVESIRL